MEVSIPGYEIEISPAQMRDWSRWFLKLADKIPHKKPSMLISDHAQKYRVMPPGSRFPGRLDLSRTPYLIEPMNNMSPMSPVQRTVSMKCAQSGWTMGCIECPICYYIGYSPADQLMLSAGDRIIRRCFGMEIDPQYCQVSIQRWADFTGRDEIKINGQPVSWSEYIEHS